MTDNHDTYWTDEHGRVWCVGCKEAVHRAVEHEKQYSYADFCVSFDEEGRRHAVLKSSVVK